jgi:hypothetical protein
MRQTDKRSDGGALLKGSCNSPNNRLHINPMPKALAVDWTTIKALIIKGVAMPDVAKQFAIPYNTLKQRAFREKWGEQVTAVEKAVYQAVTREASANAKNHVNTVVNLLGKHLQALQKRDADTLEWQDFETATKILDRLDQIGRRSHGLDAEQANARSATLVQVVINTKDTALTPIDVDTDGVIDVESSPGPATGPS